MKNEKPTPIPIELWTWLYERTPGLPLRSIKFRRYFGNNQIVLSVRCSQTEAFWAMRDLEALSINNERVEAKLYQTDRQATIFFPRYHQQALNETQERWLEYHQVGLNVDPTE
jgi:hypothetical protein